MWFWAAPDQSYDALGIFNLKWCHYISLLRPPTSDLELWLPQTACVQTLLSKDDAAVFFHYINAKYVDMLTVSK